MTLFTKLRKNSVFIVLLGFILINQPKLQAQRYSIDKKPKRKLSMKHFSFRRLFKNDASQAAAKQVKKDDKHMTKVMTNQQKTNRKYQKKANKDKEKGQSWKVYSRMRKYEKQAERRRHNKPDKNFFQRLFSFKRW